MPDTRHIVGGTVWAKAEAVSKDCFIESARDKPDVCVKLIVDMARLIGDLNETITLLAKPRGAGST